MDYRPRRLRVPATVGTSVRILPLEGVAVLLPVSPRCGALGLCWLIRCHVCPILGAVVIPFDGVQLLSTAVFRRAVRGVQNLNWSLLLVRRFLGC